MCVSRGHRFARVETPSKEEGELEMDFFKVLDADNNSWPNVFQAFKLSTNSTDEKEFQAHIYWLTSHLVSGTSRRDKKQNRLVFLAIAQSLMRISKYSHDKYKFIAYTIIDKLKEVKELHIDEFISDFKNIMKL
jgi:hypothetical protein